MNKSRIQQLKDRLEVIEEEKRNILSELANSKKTIIKPTQDIVFLGTPASHEVPTTTEEKVLLFLSLFRCRESVFPKLWENSSKRIRGYSPVCNNEWVSGICEKPKLKCVNCSNQAFRKLDSDIVQGHLLGHYSIGTYAIREDDTCAFLAADFDGSG